MVRILSNYNFPISSKGNSPWASPSQLGQKIFSYLCIALLILKLYHNWSAWSWKSAFFILLKCLTRQINCPIKTLEFRVIIYVIDFLISVFYTYVSKILVARGRITILLYQFHPIVALTLDDMTSLEIITFPNLPLCSLVYSC